MWTRSTTSSAPAAARSSPGWSTRLRLEPDDVEVILPYEEVIEALGFRQRAPAGPPGRRDLDAIVGTVDRERDFDRRFRPTSARVRGRWEQIAAAMRRGESLPPVDLIKIGEIYFVRDGHHRVSVARALGRADIDAYVTEVITRVGVDHPITISDLPLKSHERVFFERVPLPDEARSEIRLYGPVGLRGAGRGGRGVGLPRDPEATARRSTARRPRGCGSRPSTGRSSRCCARRELIGHRQTETEAYMRVAAERYRLLRTHTLERRGAPARGRGARPAPLRRRVSRAPLGRPPPARAHPG